MSRFAVEGGPDRGPKKDWEFWASFHLPRGNDSKITLHIADTPPIEGLVVPKKSDK